MKEAHIAADTPDQTAPARPIVSTFVIDYLDGDSQATSTWNGKRAEILTAHPGEAIAISFKDFPQLAGAKVSQAMMLVNTQGRCSHASPFPQSSPIDLLKNPQLAIRPDANGTWGFSIAFVITNPNGTAGFYYVPDPELAVGST